MTFEQVFQPAIDLAENGFPLSEDRARLIAGAQKILKYPSTVKIYRPNGEAPNAGDIFKNPDLARTLNCKAVLTAGERQVDPAKTVDSVQDLDPLLHSLHQTFYFSRGL